MTRRRFAPMLLALIVALGLLPLSPASAARNRPPRIKKAVMKDTDGDGMANKVVLTYNEKIKHRLDSDGRYPFVVQGYKVRKVKAARRTLKLIIVVKPTAKAKPRPDFIRYARTKRQPVLDLKKLQAKNQELSVNIVGVPPLPETTRTLNLTKSGDGAVTSSPAGISCDSACTSDSGAFADGTQVTLTAAPGAESAPEVAWTGCDAYTATSCSVTMTSDKNVGVTFAAAGQKSLSVSKEGDGTVSSSSTPAQDSQINCGLTCASTTATYPANTLVTVTAAPAQEGMFVTWGGDCSGTGQTCDLLMDAAKTVTVKFELPTLTVTKSGDGSGTVTSSPAGINCGSTCTAEFAKDANVTLTATPASGSEFGGWSGDATCGLELSCSIPMSASKNVTATFAPANSGTGGATKYDLSVSKNEGSVTCLASDGGTACNGSYNGGTTVTITATPEVGSLNIVPSWTGCDSNPLPNSCVVTMNANRSVSVTWGT